MLETLNNSRFECFVRTFSLTLHHTHRQCFFVESFNLFLLFIPWSFCMLPFIFASFLNNVRIYLPCIQLRVNPYPFRCFNNAKTLDLYVFFLLHFAFFMSLLCAKIFSATVTSFHLISSLQQTWILKQRIIPKEKWHSKYSRNENLGLIYANNGVIYVRVPKITCASNGTVNIECVDGVYSIWRQQTVHHLSTQYINYRQLHQPEQWHTFTISI